MNRTHLRLRPMLLLVCYLMTLLFPLVNIRTVQARTQPPSLSSNASVNPASLDLQTAPPCDPATQLCNVESECDLGKLPGATSRQWVYVTGSHDPQVLEGVVTNSFAAYDDSPINHHSRDRNFFVDPDPAYDDLVADSNWVTGDAAEIGKADGSGAPDRLLPERHRHAHRRWLDVVQRGGALGDQYAVARFRTINFKNECTNPKLGWCICLALEKPQPALRTGTIGV